MKEAQVKRRCNDFTLVELLVVIGLASLLFGIVLPAFSRMVTGSAVNRLASNLKLRLARAQSHAASSRGHVALLLPNGATSVWTKSNEQAARLGGSRMCYVDWNVDTHKAAFKAWVPDDDWTEPDRGAFLIRATSSASNVAAEGSAQTILTNAGRDTLLDNSSADESKPLKDLTGALSGSSTADPVNCAVVFGPKGNVRTTEDLYLVIAEGAVNGTSLVFPGGGGAYNCRALKVNHVTGRVEYHR